MPTSTRCGEERNRPTRAWVKTGSPASTSRTWSRPDTQPDELSASLRHGRHPLVARTAVSSAPSGTRAYTAVVSGVLRPLNSPLHGMHAHRHHAGDRGAELLVLAPHDYLHINQMRMFDGCGGPA